MRAAFMILLVAVPLLAGCMSQPQACPAIARAPPQTLSLPQEFQATDARQAWETLALRDGDWSGWNVSLDPKGNAESKPVAPGSPLWVVRAHPGDGTSVLRLSATSAPLGDGCGGGTVAVDWSLAAPSDGTVAQPGQGVRVWYAGFWENGTMFETNIKEIDESDWPRAGWYESIPFETLPVYIYDKAPDERSPLWSATTAGTPASPVTGGVGLWSYYTTIKGFNDGLKALSTHTVHVVHMDAKDAYPEIDPSHPAGIDAVPLLFFVRLESVHELPCPDDATLPCVPAP